MVITWLCLLLMSYNVCESGCENISVNNAALKQTEVQTTKPFKKNSFGSYIKLFYKFFKQSKSCMKRFLIWIKKYIRHGIQCIPFGNLMRCSTKTGTNKKVSMDFWYQIPRRIRNRWTKNTPLNPDITITKDNYQRDSRGNVAKHIRSRVENNIISR